MEENSRWNPKLIGAFIGLIIGVILVLTGALKAFIVALFILLGWLIGNYFAGGFDLDQFYDRYLRGKTRGSRK
jgi:uncharacterized membrane protein